MEAFLYCWTDRQTDRLYIGAHKGSEDDGYISSSKVFNEQYQSRPQDFTRQIIAHGSQQDILHLESQVLLSVGAAQSDDFYNRSNGNGNFYHTEHTAETKAKMSRTWKRKGVFNVNQPKAVDTWRGSSHTDEARLKMSVAQAKHSESRSEAMSINNPMKNPESVARMLAARKLNREIKNGHC